MVPSSVSNRKTAAAEVGAGEPVLGLVKPLTLNPPVGPPSVLNTVPVGVPDAPSGVVNARFLLWNTGHLLQGEGPGCGTGSGAPPPRGGASPGQEKKRPLEAKGRAGWPSAHSMGVSTLLEPVCGAGLPGIWRR